MRNRWLRLAALPLACSLIAVSCGDDETSDTDPPSGETGGETTSGETGGETTSGETGGETTSGGTDTETTSGDTGGETTAVESGSSRPSIDGAEVTISGPERAEEEAGAIQQVLAAWGEENGVEVTYSGDADWETNINIQVEGGDPPDIAIFPQPGKLADFARDEFVVPLDEGAAAATAANWAEKWTVFGNVDGTQYGVPVKADLKSLVWYQPARFEAAGYEVPTTFEEFTALIEEMAGADGPKPLCVGIESAEATGWTFTDWTEDLVLRQHGADVYDQWVSHEIPFDDPQIVESMQTVIDIWTEENVFASSGSIVSTSFQDNGQPLVNGDCYMHRQASFFSAFIPVGTPFADGSEEAVDVFYLPDVNGDKPVLAAGTLAAGFNDEPATMAVLEYMSTADYAEARQAAQAELKGGGEALSGFLSAANDQDPSVYQPLEQNFLEILDQSEIVRFDASDLMPADVGSGSFWSEATALVNGDQTVEEAAAKIEGTWPK